MKKVKLILDDLNVDSFETSAEKTGDGTVFAKCITCTDACNCTGGTGGGTGNTDCGCGGTAYTDCGDCELSRYGAYQFTCDVNCFSHYTDCHRC